MLRARFMTEYMCEMFMLLYLSFELFDYSLPKLGVSDSNEIKQSKNNRIESY